MRDERVAGLFQTLATDTPDSIREKAHELAAGLAGTLPFAPGDKAGPYEIVSVLGSGGQAVVYEAVQKSLERRVALKVPRREVGDRIVREAKLLASLTHPSIVQVFDLDLEGDIPYLVLELCEGWSLEERLDVVAPDGLPLEQVQRVAASVLEALAFAHERGVIHRDVKPSNILFDRENNPKVSDFGIGTIARVGELAHSAEMSQLSLLAGTPLYVAPEQENPALRVDGRLDGRADLFSFGKVLFQMLTGASPRTIRPASRLRPGLDPAWDELVFQLTEERPERRFADAREVLAVLERLGGAKVLSAPEAPTDLPPVPEIAAEWRLDGELPREGSMLAYRVRATRTGMPAVLRVTDAATPADSEAGRNLLRAAILASKPHPQVARVLVHGATRDGRIYTVTDESHARPLSELVAKGEQLLWAKALTIVTDVARGFATLEGASALRNLTPDAILLTDEGRGKLRVVPSIVPDPRATRLGREYASLVDARALAPEATGGEAADARAEIYSLGAIFYRLVTGRFPCVADTPLELFAKIGNGEIEPPEKFAPELPRGVRRVLGKMLATRREDRYATWLALLEDLEALASGRPIKAGEPRLWHKRWFGPRWFTPRTRGRTDPRRRPLAAFFDGLVRRRGARRSAAAAAKGPTTTLKAGAAILTLFAAGLLLLASLTRSPWAIAAYTLAVPLALAVTNLVCRIRHRRPAPSREDTFAVLYSVIGIGVLLGSAAALLWGLLAVNH